jgi:hypothetical protein
VGAKAGSKRSPLRSAARGLPWKRAVADDNRKAADEAHLRALKDDWLEAVRANIVWRMTEDLFLRALGAPEPRVMTVPPAGQVVVLTVKPAFSFPLTLWYETSGGAAGAVLGAASMSGHDLLMAAGALSQGKAPPPAPSARRKAIALDALHGGDVGDALARANLYALSSKPLTGTDGMTIAVQARSGARGFHAFDAWEPRGDHVRVLRALCAPAALCFTGAEWITSVANEALRQAAANEAGGA